MNTIMSGKGREAIFTLPDGDEPGVLRGGLLDSRIAVGGATRFIEVSDQLAWKRRERLVSIFGPANFFEISSHCVDGIVQHDNGFKVVVCSVDDVPRLRAALRAPADIIVKNKVSFAYCEKTSPSRRAHLFKLGFDDVFHAGMSDEEICLRYKSIIERQDVYDDLSRPIDDHKWQQFLAEHAKEPLRGKQKEIVQKLLHANGEVVKYRDLASYDFALNEYNMASLKATVSNVRKKLTGCDLLSKHGEGYRLLIRQMSESI